MSTHADTAMNKHVDVPAMVVEVVNAAVDQFFTTIQLRQHQRFE